MESADKSVAKSLVIIGVLFTALIIHVVQWNEYSFEILPLKLKQYTGMAKKPDFESIARICKERKKSVCVELALTRALQLAPDDKNVLFELSKLRMERKLYRDVVRLLSQYLRLGGTDVEARFLLSQALFHTGDFTNAKKQLNYLIFSSKEKADPDVARFYVKVLMQKREWNSAQKVILHFRKSRRNASYFLEKEFKEIRRKLQRNRSKRA